MLLTTFKLHENYSRLLLILAVGALGGLAILLAAWAAQVTIAPLLLLGPPVVFVSALLRLNSLLILALLGFLLYASYAWLLTQPKPGAARWASAVIILVFHGATLFALNLLPWLVGEGL